MNLNPFDVVIGIVIGVVLTFAFLGVLQYALKHFKTILKDSQAEAVKQAVGMTNQTLQESVREITENILANSEEKVQNVAVSPSGTKPPDKPPFWQNPAALRDAKKRIEEAGSEPHDIAELGTTTNHEAWRKLDERLLEMESNNSEPDISR